VAVGCHPVGGCSFTSSDLVPKAKEQRRVQERIASHQNAHHGLLLSGEGRDSAAFPD